MGCSTHSVPSWSNVAMRSAGGTNFGLPCEVVACTNSTIALFAAPSFQEESGSPAGCATALPERRVEIAATAMAARARRVRSCCMKGVRSCVRFSVVRRRQAFELVQALHGLHRLERGVIDVRRVQAATLLEIGRASCRERGEV